VADGWKPSEYHGGLAGILNSRKFPTAYCIRDTEYIEAIDDVVTGWKDKQRKLKVHEVEECGDTVHGGRAEVRKPKGTLTFTMDSSPRGQEEK